MQLPDYRGKKGERERVVKAVNKGKQLKTFSWFIRLNIICFPLSPDLLAHVRLLSNNKKINTKKALIYKKSKT